MALTLNSSQLAAPKAEQGCVEGWILIGSQERNLSGAMTQDLMAWKRTWTINWGLITGTEVSTIESAAAATPPVSFTPLYGGSFNVVVRSFQKTPRYLKAGTFYDVTLNLEEA